MTTKSLLIVGALTLSSIGVASAKTFDVVLGAPAMAGTIELKPGDYKLKVEGSQAIFKELQSSKSFTVPVKVESADRKFGQTVVESTTQNGMDNIQSIDLAGSNTKLEFGH
jgi:VCBS repeat-containing protein